MSVVDFIDELETEFEEKYDTESANEIVTVMEHLKLNKTTKVTMKKFQELCCVLYSIHDNNNHPIEIYKTLKNAGYNPTFAEDVLEL